MGQVQKDNDLAPAIKPAGQGSLPQWKRDQLARGGVTVQLPTGNEQWTTCQQRQFHRRAA
jgi:hypothetical protein